MIPALLYPDARQETAPPAGETYTLDELQTLVGGQIEVINLPDTTLLVFDEEGKIKVKPLNAFATTLALDVLMPGDYLVGAVLHCPSELIR